jgi:hypothetical protein
LAIRVIEIYVKQAKFVTEKHDNSQDSEEFRIGSLTSTRVRIVLKCLNYIDSRLLDECENISNSVLLK